MKPKYDCKEIHDILMAASGGAGVGAGSSGPGGGAASAAGAPSAAGAAPATTARSADDGASPSFMG